MADQISSGPATGKKQKSNGTDDGLTGAASSAVAEVKAEVTDRVTAQVETQRTRAADHLGSVAGALRKAGEELRSKNSGLASYADMAVDELEQFSSRIRDKAPGEYMADLESLARRRPLAFVGGTFLLGLTLARFLKSSSPERRPTAGRPPTQERWPGSTSVSTSAAPQARPVRPGTNSGTAAPNLGTPGNTSAPHVQGTAYGGFTGTPTAGRESGDR